MVRRLLILSLGLAAAGCGKVADLEPAAGKPLPVKPMMARATPTPEQLLTPPPQARPDRIDELLKKSEPRETDPFDLPPPTGGSAPPAPAGGLPDETTTENVTVSEPQ